MSRFVCRSSVGVVGFMSRGWCGLRKKFKLLAMLQEHFGSKPEQFYDVFVPMEVKAWELREPELQ